MLEKQEVLGSNPSVLRNVAQWIEHLHTHRDLPATGFSDTVCAYMRVRIPSSPPIYGDGNGWLSTDDFQRVNVLEGRGLWKRSQ